MEATRTLGRYTGLHSARSLQPPKLMRRALLTLFDSAEQPSIIQCQSLPGLPVIHPAEVRRGLNKLTNRLAVATFVSTGSHQRPQQLPTTSRDPLISLAMFSSGHVLPSTFLEK